VDVDDPDAAGRGDPGKDLVEAPDPGALLGRVAVIGAGRRDRVVRGRDDKDPVRPETPDEIVEDPIDVPPIRVLGHALDDVVDADEEADELGLVRREGRQLEVTTSRTGR
jgi:hypothetical protein